LETFLERQRRAQRLFGQPLHAELGGEHTMSSKKHTKAQEEAYRRGYHQAVNVCLRLVEAAVEQQVDAAQVVALFTRWEHQLSRWRGQIDETHLHDEPPPLPMTPHLRLVQKEQPHGTE
jgi:hypothetical protein